MIDKKQALINKESCKLWIDVIMTSKFAEALARKLEEKGISQSELARRARMSRANVSRLINDTPHPITDVLPKTTEESVEAIAKALDWDINEARLAAGYAPASQTVIANNMTLAQIDFYYPGLPKAKRGRVDLLIEMLLDEIKKAKEAEADEIEI